MFMLPRDIYIIIGTWLELVDYHRFRAAIYPACIPLVPHVSFTRYRQLTTDWLIKDPSVSCKLYFEAIDPDSIRYLVLNGHVSEFTRLFPYLSSLSWTVSYHQEWFELASVDYRFFPEIVSLLLRHGNINPGCNENSALLSAIRCGHPIVTELLNHPLINPSLPNNMPIRIACIKGYLQAVTLLLDDDRVSPSCKGNMPLLNACRFGHASVAHVLIRHPRVDLSINKYRLVHTMAIHGLQDLLSILLCKIHHVDDSEFEKALKNACRVGHVKVVKTLLLHNADSRKLLLKCKQIAEDNEQRLVLEFLDQMDYSN
jgi:hypothetical protein